MKVFGKNEEGRGRKFDLNDLELEMRLAGIRSVCGMYVGCVCVCVCVCVVSQYACVGCGMCVCAYVCVHWWVCACV